MNDKDKMYILNDILGEVKPLYLRQRVGARFIEFVDNKIPEGSVVLSKEEYNALLLEQKRLREIVDRIPCGYELKETTRKQAVKEVLSDLKNVWKMRAKEYNTLLGNKEKAVAIDLIIKDIGEIAKEFGVEL